MRQTTTRFALSFLLSVFPALGPAEAGGGSLPSPLGGRSRESPRLPDDFPLTDFHVHLKGGLTLEEALGLSRERGVRFGIAVNGGRGFPIADDTGLRRFLAELDGRPVYRGLQAEGREWLDLFSPECIAGFDYVLTDAMTFWDRRGRRTRLWIPDEVHIENRQEFMDLCVDRIVSIIENEPIDIYANATFLPEALAGDYDRLWTEERMERVIRAAVKNDVAIEINARFRIPGAAFVRKAKRAGAKFSFGTNNSGRDLGNLDYCIRMAVECGLGKKDMFTPRAEDEKPIRRRGGWKKEQRAARARDLLKASIARGGELAQRGDPARCEKAYRDACVDVLNLLGAESGAGSALQKALAGGGEAEERSLTVTRLRSGLEAAVAALETPHATRLR